MVKGPILAVFHQIWTSEGPNVVKITSAHVWGPFPVTFPGGKFWYHGKKNWPTFGPVERPDLPYAHFFYEKIFFRPGLFFSRLEQPKMPPKAPGLASVAAAVLWQHSFHCRPPDRAAGSEVPGSAGALVRFGAHSPPTRRTSCFMPRGTARAHLTTDAAILPTPRPLPSMLPERTLHGGYCTYFLLDGFV